MKKIFSILLILPSLTVSAQMIGVPGSSAAYPWQFRTNGSTKVTIDSSGKVGIGTITPTEKLDVVGSIKASENITATKAIHTDTVYKGVVPVTFSRTQWFKTITNQTVTAGNSLNLFTLIPNDSIIANGTDAFGRLNIVSNGIIMSWYGKPMYHTIRVVYNLATGSTQTYQLELRRVSDNSVIATSQIVRNNDTQTATALIDTYTGSASDPFVTGGFYIAFRNTSGSSAVLTTSVNLLITTIYQ